MAKLRFFARDDLLVTVPGSRPLQGQAPQYVGRKFIPGDGKQGALFPATEEPYSCDAESEEGARLVLLTRRDAALWPADAETARACELEFVAVKVTDGVAMPEAKAAPAADVEFAAVAAAKPSASRAQKGAA